MNVLPRDKQIAIIAALSEGTSFRQLTGEIIRPVQKSPSLTVTESWLSTWVSTSRLTVSRTICFP